MRMVGLGRLMVGAVLAAELLALPAIAAPPPCGRKACREEIRACQESDCSGLSGNARARCKKACVKAVQAACNEDVSVCSQAVTTTTGAATTSSAPPATTSTSSTSTSSSTTTLMGSPSGGFVD